MNKIFSRQIKFCLLFIILTISSPGILKAQSIPKVTLNVKNARLEQVMNEIEKQTNLFFIVEKGVDVRMPITINASNAPLASVLDRISAVAGAEYKLYQKNIYLSLKKATPVANTPPATIISGKVVGQSGDIIHGVAVIERGTDNGVVVGFDGSYSITLKNTPAILSFQALGYMTEEIQVESGRKVLNVTLQEDSQLIEETVVIGYGTQARKTLSTSVSKVDGDKLYGAPVATVGDALKGKVSGLRIATSNSLSGQSPRFLIRGGSSINMDNDPIYIVDGALRSDIDDVNPNDIESLEVLKDAASAAIYGARASNGVILVTTKKGSPSKGPEIVFDSQMGIKEPERTWDLLSSAEFLDLTRRSISNMFANATGTLEPSLLLDGATAMGTGNTSSSSLYTNRYLDRGESVPDGYLWMVDPLDASKVIIFKDTDFQSQWMHHAFYQKQYIGVNGGNDSIKYAASISYLEDEGVFAMTGTEMFTTHANVSFKVTNSIEAFTTFDLSREKTDGMVDNYFNVFGRGIMFAPTAKGFDEEAGWLSSGGNANSKTAEFYEKFYSRERRTNRISSTFGLRWTILDGLAVSAQYTFYDSNYRGSYYAYGEVDGYSNPVSSTRSTTETNDQTSRNTVTASLSYNKSFNRKHNLGAVAGWELMKQRYWYLTAKSTGSVSDDVPILDSGVNFTVSNKDQEQALMSAFARVSYDYMNKYVLSASFRADGSSKFAKGNRWGYFPGASAAWIISEEPFFIKWKNTINTLKFRLSYGMTGNNGVGIYDSYGSFSTDLYNGSTTLLPSSMQNSSMKWETTTQLDAGLDIGFLKDRVRIIMDYYNKRTDNMIFSITLPDTVSYSSVKANVGTARFYGFEFELNADVIARRDFTWTLGFTYSYNANRVLSLPEEYAYEEVDEYGNPTGKIAYRIGGYTMTETGYRFGGIAVGEPLGRIYGYKIDHVIQTEAEADAALYDSNTYGFRVSDGLSITGRKDAGDYAFMNRYGSAKDTDGNEIINSEDMFYLGNVMPHSVGGINNTFRYKRLTFNIYFDYAIGHSIYNYMKTRMLQNTMGYSNSAIASYVKYTWTSPDDTDYKYAHYFPNDADYGNKNFSRISDFNVEMADYICLRDVSIYYDLPQKWTKKAGIKKVTVGVSGNTIHYFTGVTGGINPETGIGSSSSADQYTYVNNANSSSSDTGNIFPATSTFLFNLKLTF